MTKIKADVMIVGGGLVGITQAIALAEHGMLVTVIDRVPYSEQLHTTFDGRASAIAWSSHSLLKNLGIWKFMEPEAEPIWHIRVTDENSPAIVHYDSKETYNHPFGYIVENRFLRHALEQRMRECGSLKFLAPMQMKGYHIEDTKTAVTLENSDVVEAPLLISAEGRKSFLRGQENIETLHMTYGQTAIVVTISHEKPHGGLALECFKPIGPFAVLPMTHNRSCLVWTESETVASVYAALPEAELKQEIAARLGDYLGDFTLLNKPFIYPLTLLQAKDYISKRFALIGDSAHGIHPIAGQGVNVGFRDVAVLTERILDAAKLGLDIGSAAVLEGYQQSRRPDGVAMAIITDGLNRLFSNDMLPIKLARRTGLAAVNAMPNFKRAFTDYAMGIGRDLPKLLKDAA
jgi:2-octaprenyl-6-methoxyphenol hydroxylase